MVIWESVTPGVLAEPPPADELSGLPHAVATRASATQTTAGPTGLRILIRRYFTRPNRATPAAAAGILGLVRCVVKEALRT